MADCGRLPPHQGDGTATGPRNGQSRRSQAFEDRRATGGQHPLCRDEEDRRPHPRRRPAGRHFSGIERSGSVNDLRVGQRWYSGLTVMPVRPLVVAPTIDSAKAARPAHPVEPKNPAGRHAEVFADRIAGESMKTFALTAVTNIRFAETAE